MINFTRLILESYRAGIIFLQMLESYIKLSGIQFQFILKTRIDQDNKATKALLNFNPKFIFLVIPSYYQSPLSNTFESGLLIQTPIG